MKPIIAIANNKGGAGKTATALHLGWCMAGMGHPVTLVDGDGQANLTANLGIADHGLGLADLLAGGAVDYFHLAHWPADLRLITGDARLDDTAAEMTIHPLRLSRLATALAAQTYNGGTVLIDTPPNVGALVLAALVAATHVIIPAVPVAESIAGVRRTLQLLDEMRREMGRAPVVLGIVATHVQHETRLHQTGLDALDAFGLPILGCIPHRVGRDAESQLRAAYAPVATRLLGYPDQGGAQ